MNVEMSPMPAIRLLLGICRTIASYHIGGQSHGIMRAKSEHNWVIANTVRQVRLLGISY